MPRTSTVTEHVYTAAEILAALSLAYPESEIEFVLIGKSRGIKIIRRGA